MLLAKKQLSKNARDGAFVTECIRASISAWLPVKAGDALHLTRDTINDEAFAW